MAEQALAAGICVYRRTRIQPAAGCGSVRRAWGLAAAALLVAAEVAAQITAVPPSVSMFPTQSSSTVSLTIQYNPPTGSGTGNVYVTGAPAGVTTVPPIPTFTFAVGTVSATTSFHFQATAAAVPGTYPISMTSTGVSCGTSGPCTGNMTLQIAQPSFTATASPNPVSLTWGAAAQSVTVSTTVDPGLSEGINYTFAGFPSGISTGAPQVVGPPFAPVTFPFSVATGTAPGTYTGSLRGTLITSGTIKNFPFTVVVAQPDILVSFTQPAMSLCNGGTAVASGAVLTPVVGYAGTPLLSFTSVPTGITVTPTNPTASPMPPGQTVPFTVRASGAATGTQSVSLRVRDTTAGIDKTASFTVTVSDPQFTPSVAPTTVTVQPDGPATTLQASVTGNTCFSASTVTVTPSGVPPGVTFTPASLTLTGPAYAPASFAVQAAAGAAPGTYPITLTFAPSTGTARTAMATLVVSVAPDFALAVTPPAATISAGGSTTVTVSASGMNGFAATISVTSPTLPGVTFAPASFTLTAGTVQAVTVQAAAGATQGTMSATFSGTAPGITGPRTASLVLTVAGAPDFGLNVSPPALTINPGTSASVAMYVMPSNGFTGTVSVTSPTLPGITFTPSTFTLAPGGSQTVTVQVAASAAAGTTAATFTGTAAGITGTRTASLVLTVTPAPDFALSVAPLTVTLAPGAAGTVTVTATPLNGFVGTVSVTAPVLPGITFTPASFALAAGGSQMVTVQASANVVPGTTTATFTGTATGITGTRTALLTLTVVAAPDFALSVAPPALSITAGTTATVAVTATTLNGFAGVVNVTAPVVAGVTFTPASFTLGGGASQSVTVQVSAGAAPGTTAATFTGTAAGITGTRTASLTLTVVPPPDFAVSVVPPTLTVTPGTPGFVVVSVTPANGFTGMVNVASPALGGITFNPPTFTLAAGASQTVIVQAAASVPPGTTAATFTGTAPGITGPRLATLTLTISPAPPIIVSVTPPALSAGTMSNVLRLVGQNFRPGATATSATPGVTLVRTTVLSPTLAEVVADVARDAQPGPYSVALTNPDGTHTPQPATVLVYRCGSLGGPLAVTTAAIVFPRPYTAISPDQPLFARGLLATTGLGVIIGTWRYDGVPYDTFTANASGGMPVEVISHVPIPLTYSGAHRLELAVLQPQDLVTEPVTVIQSITSRSRLEIYAPEDGATFGEEAPLFRWSLVPGASGYEVEIATAGRDRSVRRRLSASEWRPSARDIEEIGPGEHRVRVRAVFPGEVAGEPTAWRRFVVTPTRVELSFLPPALDPKTGLPIVRWHGGAPGLTYRLDFLAGEDRHPLATALTVHQQYRLPAGAGSVLHLRVRVAALSPDGSQLGETGFADLPAVSGRVSLGRELVLANAPAEVVTRSPEEGETVTAEQPTITVQWSGSVAPPDVTLTLDGTDMTGMARIDEGGLSLSCPAPLTPGPHTVQLSLGGVVTSWSFTVAPPIAGEGATAGGTPGEAAPSYTAGGGELPHNWQVAVLGSAADTRDSGTIHGDAARMQVTGQADIGSEAAEVKAAGDYSGRHDLESPHATVGESGNWQLQLSTKQDGFREEAKVGYSPPAFLDQSEFLAAGLARGGAEVKLQTPISSFSYYETFSSKPAGAAGCAPGLGQKIRGIGIEGPWDPTRYLVRAIALRSDMDADSGFAGARGEGVGLFTRLAFSPALTLLFEGAYGRYRPAESSSESKHNGYGIHLGLSGASGTVTYSLNLRRAEAGLVNPANLGLTYGAIPDRVGGDLSLGKSFGRTMLSLQLHRMESGPAAGGEGQTIVEDGGALNLTQPLGTTVTLTAGGTITTTSGNADPSCFLPRVSRTQRGATLGLTETPGAISFSQMFSYQQMRDSVMPATNQTMSSAILSANGTLAPVIMISAMASGTRSEGEGAAGTTDQFLVSLQPTITWPQTFLTIVPRAAYTRVSNDVSDMTSKTEQYQLMIQWAPPWVRSLANFQVAADWNRTSTNLAMSRTPFDRRIVATLTLQWGAQSTPAQPATPPPPPQTAVGLDPHHPVVVARL